MRECADVCVIGSGAGGAVVAKELSELGRDVVLLEEGPYATPDDYTGNSLETTLSLFKYFGGTVTLGVPGIALPYGSAVGGTTVINSGTCFRTPTDVLKKWRNDERLTSLTDAAIEPYYDRVEKTLGIAPVDESLFGRNTTLFRDGARAIGLHGRALNRCAKGCLGTGLCQWGCPTGAKQSMQVSYLPLAVKAGARLYADCRAEGIDVRGGEVRAVSAVVVGAQNGAVRRVRVEAKAVVVAAGAIGTPLFLRRAGVATSRMLGRHLAIHPCAKVYAAFDDEVRGWEGVSQAYFVDDFVDDDILLEGIFVPPTFTALALPFVGARHTAIMAKYRHLASIGCIVSDHSRGRVRRSIWGTPIMTYNLARDDARRLQRAIIAICRIWFAVGAREVYPAIAGLPVLKDAREVALLESRDVRPAELELIAFHPMGTARMADDARRGVVDESMKVFGVSGLYVADASVFPSSIRVNPQETIMAFATRAAEVIDARIARSSG